MHNLGKGVSTLILLVAQRCNLACGYCYAVSEAGRGPYGNLGIMNEDVASQAVELLFRESKKEWLTIVFTGGEPLLGLPTIKTVVNHGNRLAAEKGRQLSFELCTNGILLTKDTVRYLVDRGFYIQVSLDGRRKNHDESRTYPNGRGTHSIVLRKFKQLSSICPDRVSVRGVITKNNLHCLKTFQYLLEQGAQKLSLAPVYTKDPRFSLNQDELEAVNREFAGFADEFQKAALDSKLLCDGQFMDVLRLVHEKRSGLCAPRSSFCGAGRSMFCVDIDGYVSPCHGFAGYERYRCGDVFAGIDYTKLGSYLELTGVERKSKCSNCDVSWICGGGCAHAAYAMNGDVTEPYEIHCGFLKNLYRLVVATYERLRSENEEILAYLLNYNQLRPIRERMESLLKGYLL